MGLAMAEMQAPVVPEAANVVLFNPQATQNRKAK
jgi:hypothetical protein